MKRIELGHVVIAVAVIVAGAIVALFPRFTPLQMEIPPSMTAESPSYKPGDDLESSCREIHIKYTNGTEAVLEAGKGELAAYQWFTPVTGRSFLVIHLGRDVEGRNSTEDRMLVPYATISSITCKGK